MGALHSIESRDGSVIGFERLGSGPAMVLVHGGTADRTRWAPVVNQLAERFTVHVVDRRGRGLSTAEKGPYDIVREGEDIAAVVNAAGRDVYLVGHSYGALCSLEAALLTDAIGRMALYEPPAATPGHHVVAPSTLDRLKNAVAADNRDGLLETFYREVIHMSAADIDAMRPTPMWRARLAAGPTIVRELEVVEQFDISDRLSKITIPVRFMLGTESPAYFKPAAQAMMEKIRQANVVLLHGQAHAAMDHDPEQFLASLFSFAQAM